MRDYYEDVWGDAPRDPEPWAFERRRALLLDHARPGERWLDLGCGAGRFTVALTNAGVEAVGIEIAGAALDRARANAPSTEFHLLDDAGSFPLKDATFDGAWCSEVLEHVADTQRLLSETRRVLKPGGKIVITTPAHGLVRRTAIALLAFERHFDPLGGHLRFFTRRSLAATLEALGFDAIQVRSRRGQLIATATRPGPAPRRTPPPSSDPPARSGSR